MERYDEKYKKKYKRILNKEFDNEKVTIHLTDTIMNLDDLTLTEKVVLTVIYQFHEFKEGGCVLSNAEIAELVGISQRQVSRVIQSLIDKERVLFKYTRKGGWNVKRVISFLPRI